MMMVDAVLTEYKSLEQLTIAEYLAKVDKYTGELKREIDNVERMKTKKPLKHG